MWKYTNWKIIWTAVIWSKSLKFLVKEIYFRNKVSLCRLFVISQSHHILLWASNFFRSLWDTFSCNTMGILSESRLNGWNKSTSPDVGVVGSNVNIPPEDLDSSARTLEEKNECSRVSGVWLGFVYWVAHQAKLLSAACFDSRATSQVVPVRLLASLGDE